MYEYSVIKDFMKQKAKYKNVEITDDEATILSFYAQENYKKYNNGKKLFETYVEKDIEFYDNCIDKDDCIFLEKIWSTYSPIIKSNKLNLYIANERNYKIFTNK